MARQFSTNDFAHSTFDLSSFSVISLSFRAWIDSYDNSGNKVLLEYGTPAFTNASGFILVPDWTNGEFLVGFSNATGSALWLDTFPRPSAGAWHNYLINIARTAAVDSNSVYVDGVVQTMTPIEHDAGSYGNFGNSSCYLFSRAGSSLFEAGRIADLAIWGNVSLDIRTAAAINAGNSPVQIANVGKVVNFAPFYGAGSPEGDYSGVGNNWTLSGTTIVNHPSAQNFFIIRHGGRRSSRH